MPTAAARTRSPDAERALLRAARAGDPAAWQALVAQAGPGIYALCRRLDPDPEDAYQAVWERICQSLDRHDPDRGAFGPWARTVARRQLIDRHRRAQARGGLAGRLGPAPPEAPPIEAVADGGPTAEQRLVRHHRQQRLEGAVQRLPPGQRRVVVLHHIEGLELAELARLEGVPLGTIKSRLHRARARLLRLLGGGA